MTGLILFGSFAVMLLCNVSIAVALGLSSVLALLSSDMSLSMVPANYYASSSKFVLLAIPFFILGGNIMAKTGISTRLINLARSMVGHIRGGLAIVCVITSCFFAAISGSGPATVAALGAIIIPAMVEQGYRILTHLLSCLYPVRSVLLFPRPFFLWFMVPLLAYLSPSCLWAVSSLV